MKTSGTEIALCSSGTEVEVMIGTQKSGEAPFLITRLERAAQRSNDHWLPTNPHLTTKIRQRLQSGDYGADIEELLHEIKSDFSLFLFCVREALGALREETRTPPRNASPFEILRAAGMRRLTLILQRAGQRVSTHSLNQATESQQLRLKEIMISASAAEVLAEHQSIPAEVGFSAAMLRQLGLALISWNYPTVYQRALERSDESTSLERAIDEMLGFSPALFGSYLLARWGIGDEIRGVLGRDPWAQDALPCSESQTKLRTICEVGEALARADSPDLYPHAERDWETARQALRDSLGHDGLQIVQERVRRNCHEYRGVFKETFSDTALLNPSQKIISLRDRRALIRNPYIKSCEPRIRQAIQEVYA
ncbi:MAG: HDOD domain-containing protein, partial [Proteobacteria bacterium]|nr:HDOD domain-containing protein [Pseudomonadota bacterium]